MDTSTPQHADLPPLAPTVWPSVSFTDTDAGIHFLTEVLGFVVTALYRDDTGKIQHAEARWPEGGGVMFGARGKPGEWGALAASGVYVVARDPATVDTVWERVKSAAGVEVVDALTDTDYGSHTFSVRDADGNLWSLGTYLGEERGASTGE